MKYLVLLFAVIILFTPQRVFAHTTETDGEISATIHFDPEDDPIANQQTGFYIAITDKSGRFVPSQCDCRFSVLQNGNELYSQPLFKDNQYPSVDRVTLLYTFPKRAVYQIHIVGKPVGGTSFQPFSFTFTVRAERTSRSQQSSPQDYTTNWFQRYFTDSLHVGMMIVTFSIFVIAAVIQKEREQAKKGGAKNEKTNHSRK